jgi:hypothetical protein
VLSELCRGSIFDDAAVHHYYMTLASLIGGWLSERARLETVPVKNALLTMAKNLGEASSLLSMFKSLAGRTAVITGASQGDRARDCSVWGQSAVLFW